MADKRDYYEVLGVDKSVADDELKKAYRKAAKKYHPDLHPGDSEAEKNFKEVNQIASSHHEKYDGTGYFKGLKGEELAEMGEMQKSGIIAVTDDGKPVSDASLMKKALIYYNAFVIIN